MQSLPQEFLALCRQLGDAQKRCSTAMAAQAAQIEALQRQVVRLRAQVIVRDTRLAMARDELEQMKAAHPGLSRRKAMALHIGVLAERIASLSRECLRWRLAALAEAVPAGAAAAARVEVPVEAGSVSGRPADSALDANLAAADLVICQTGCISHDEYWRVQDHCRRTGKPCILVDQPLAVREAEALAAIQPMVVLRMVRAQPPADPIATGQKALVLSENGR